MSGLQARSDDHINGVDVREQGSALRVATNTPHLVSLGTGRLSTAVTLHPIKQGRVTIGSDPTCDIHVVGTGVANIHCRVENSHGVVTLYPVSGSTLVDATLVDKPTRLSQGSMLTIGRSNYLRFNHPEEAMLMKSVLPTAHISMAPVQYQPNEDCMPGGYFEHHTEKISYQIPNNQQNRYKDTSLTQLDQDLNQSIKELGRKKPPVPKKPVRDSETDEKPKMSSIMAKVSKFEYYAKAQQKNTSKSQFYTSENDISPKVFSSNSLTVNTPAKDVLGSKNIPGNYTAKNNKEKVLFFNENNAVDAKGCSYANVAIRNRTKIDDIVRNFDDSSRNERLPKKVNNVTNDHMYGKINVNKDCNNSTEVSVKNDLYGKIVKPCLPSPMFDRNPQYSPVYSNCDRNDAHCHRHCDRNDAAEGKRAQAYQERIKEEEQKQAENARLEEILSMCAEYERQASTGTPVTPTEKRPHNKIITNGSLPRSGALNNPNFVQTSEGYYKFDTSHSHNRNNIMSRSLPIQRNVSSYENYDISQINSQNDGNATQVTNHQSPYNSYDSKGRMDEIGIPIYENSVTSNNISSPVMIRRVIEQKSLILNPASPVGSPYENVYYRNTVNPKSPTTQSPRSRIKTTFAHKNLPSPQYFVFPTPPPVDNSKKPNFNIPSNVSNGNKSPNIDKQDEIINNMNKVTNNDEKLFKDHQIHKTEVEIEAAVPKVEESAKFDGIEKQLSLEEEIPMIDDSNLSDDIEFRYTKAETEIEDKVTENKPEIVKNQSFDDVKKELMADIPELDEFEKDLKQNREKVIKNITENVKKMDLESNSIESTVVLDENVNELRAKYENLKDRRKKLLAEIHEYKSKMSEIRSQEDDILRELEMEKALIKGEYDSEIAILNIEQKKKMDLLEKAKKIEEDIKQLKVIQEARQKDMQERVDIATLKVERIERNVKNQSATDEELQNAQDILDNETKIFEDLEFQHLEEESELLANREDLQNELTLLTKKIESQKCRILTLKSEANNNLTGALEETKVLQAEYVRLLNRVEEITTKVQSVEKELKPIVVKLNDIERTQSPDSAFYTDQTRAKSGEFGYSPQTSDSDDLDLTKADNYETHAQQLKDKFNSIDQMSQSMIVDIERRDINDIVDDTSRSSESPSKSSSKEKKGFWERNFDSLSRRKKDKKPKVGDKVDIMSQSLNENMFYYSDNIENITPFDKFESLRQSKIKKENKSPVKSNSSSKIPTFAALGKIIKKDSFSKKPRETTVENNVNKNRYIKNVTTTTDNKYSKAKTPDKNEENDMKNNLNSHKNTEDRNIPKVLHRKSCGDEPSGREFSISDSGKVPSQDDIDRISKVTLDAPLLASDADMNSLGKKTFDSLMEIERKRMVMLEEQGCQVIENEREKISELKRRVQDETRKLWDQKYKHEHTKSFDSDTCNSLVSDYDSFNQTNSFTERMNEPISFTDRTNDTMNSFTGHGLDSFKSDRGMDSSFRNERMNSDSFRNDRVSECVVEETSLEDPFNLTSSTIFEESSGLMSSSIEELQVRNSRTESTEDDKRSDDSRPLSHASDFSRDNILSLNGAPRRSRRAIAPYSEHQRPLTRYLPVDRPDFDLRSHLESAGHQVELCPHVSVTAASCRGYLHKLGAKFHTWSKRWFVFDRDSKTFVYYWDKTERKPRGGAYFQVIEEVYLDHGNTSKSPSPQTTFIVKTRQRRYYLMAPSGEAARIWIDAIFTGAQGYGEYLE